MLLAFPLAVALAASPTPTTIRLGGGFPDLLAVSLSGSPWGAIELEVGGSAFALPVRRASEAARFARAGPRLRLLDTRSAEGFGWTVDAALLAGGRYLRLTVPEGGPSIAGPGGDLCGAFTLIGWTGPDVGVAVRFAGGGAAIFSRTARPGSAVETAFVPQFGLSVGTAF